LIEDDGETLKQLGDPDILGLFQSPKIKNPPRYNIGDYAELPCSAISGGSTFDKRFANSRMEHIYIYTSAETEAKREEPVLSLKISTFETDLSRAKVTGTS
jgi:hypothetical protein